MEILFSVAIPAYKTQFLYEAISSVTQQTYRNWELIIVDDCSPHDIWAIVNKFDDSRIRYYRNNKNCGALNVVNNWNKCLEYANGDYIICMGDDDRLLPCCLEEYIKLIGQYPDLGVYHAWTEIIDEKGNFNKLQHPRPLYEGAYCLCWNRWNGRGLQYIGDFCFNKQKLKDDGGFYNLPMAWASDDITAVRAARYKGIANTQVLCFQYRINTLSISSSGFHNEKIKAANQEKKWYKNFLDSYIPTNELEIKYRMMVINSIERHFKEKVEMEMALDMRGKLWRLFYWFFNKRKFCITSRNIIVACEMAIKLGKI